MIIPIVLNDINCKDMTIKSDTWKLLLSATRPNQWQKLFNDFKPGSNIVMKQDSNGNKSLVNFSVKMID